MIGKIKYIAQISELFCEYERDTFDEFIIWLWEQKDVQFDIETNVCDWWNEFKIISMQFGSCRGTRIQWFLQWSELTPEQRNQIKEYLEDQTHCKLIHNATFEYVVCKFHDIIIENVYDTMLAEKVLKGGLEIENYALADISWKYLRIIMDKTLQKAFGDNIITQDKIRYGITDVAYLDIIRRQQIEQGAQENLLNVMALEMEAVLAFGDITYEGMILDKEKWLANVGLAQPLVDAATVKINSWLLKEPMYSTAVHKGYISDKDRVVINYGSWQQKEELLKLIFPDIIGASKGTIKSYLRDNGETLEPERMNILMALQSKDYQPLQDYLLTNHNEYLIEHDYLIPAGKITINWNSQPQVLPMMQLLVPKLKGLGEEEVGKYLHPALLDYQDYMQKRKLVTQYGQPFIDKYVGPDGRVRTNFNQIVSTGRVSSSNPNMQNIIVTEEVGTRYRNAFIYEPGWSFVDSDFTGQELALIADTCKDPLWINTIKRGEDLHSVCAEVVYGKQWKDAADTNCAFYAMKVNKEGQLVQGKQKCNCKKHKSLRNGVKAINFGLAYGMSEIKLAADMKISRQEALTLINKYFQAFPGIKSTLDFLGQFGILNGYIMTLWPFNRKRWFPYWREYKDYQAIHIQGIKYIPALGEIERASKNHPFQGSGADMTKVALVLVRNYIRDNNLRDKVKLVAQVHDQITTVAINEFANEWVEPFDNLMCEAGELIIPSGILKAETMVTPVWTK